MERNRSGHAAAPGGRLPAPVRPRLTGGHDRLGAVLHVELGEDDAHVVAHGLGAVAGSAAMTALLWPDWIRRSSDADARFA